MGLFIEAPEREEIAGGQYEKPVRHFVAVISRTDIIRIFFCGADLSRLMVLRLPNVRPALTVQLFVCIRKPINNHVAKGRANADSTVK